MMTTTPQTKFTHEATMRQYLPLIDTTLRGRDADMTAIRRMLNQNGIVQITGYMGVGKSRLAAEIAKHYPTGVIWHRASGISLVGDILRAIQIQFDLSDDVPLENGFVLLEKHRPLLVIDETNALSWYSSERANYEGFLTKMVALGVPVLLTGTILWDKVNAIKNYSLAPLDADSTAHIIADIAQSHNIALSPDQIAELNQFTYHDLPHITFVVGLLREIITYDRLMDMLKNRHDGLPDGVRFTYPAIFFEMAGYMLTHAENGDQADALLNQLWWIKYPFTIDLIRAIQPVIIPDEDSLTRAIGTLQAYQFLHHDPTTDMYRLADAFHHQWATYGDSMNRYDDDEEEDDDEQDNSDEAIHKTRAMGDAVFIAYNDYYTARAKVLFADLAENPKTLHQYEADYLHIITIADEWVRRTYKGTQGDLIRLLRFLYSLGDYVIYRTQDKTADWLNSGLNAVSALGKNMPDTADFDENEMQKIHASLASKLGLVSHKLGDSEAGIKHCHDAKFLYQALNDQVGKAQVFTNLGYIHYNLGQYDTARNFLEQSLNWYRKSGDAQGQINVLYSLGNYYVAIAKDYHQARHYYEQSLPLVRQLGKPQWSLILNMSIVYLYLKEPYKALQFSRESLEMARINASRLSMAKSFSAIAGVFERQNEWHKALENCRQAVPLYQQVGENKEQANILMIMSNAYFGLRQPDEGMKCIQTAISLMPADSLQIKKMQMSLRRRKFFRKYPVVEFLAKALIIIVLLVIYFFRFIFRLPRRVFSRNTPSGRG